MSNKQSGGRRTASGNQPARVIASAFENAAQSAGLTAKPGKSAIASRYQPYVAARYKSGRFTGSVDLDAEFAGQEAQSPRWDYGLGIQNSDAAEVAVWLEVHTSTSPREVDQMLRKLAWLKSKLAQPGFAKLHHLTEAARQQGRQQFIWLTAGAVGIRAGSRDFNKLAVQGLGMPRSFVQI